MCGRFSSTKSKHDLEEYFAAQEMIAELSERVDYNVAPSENIFLIRERNGERWLGEAKWGLVPSWAKDPSIGNRMINARAEQIADKASYSKAFSKRRCIIPADGFYEWKREAGKKQPYYFSLKSDEPMALAGLWEAWKPKDGGDWLISCTIITTDANEAVAPVHDRMPVVLSRDEWSEWLDPENNDIAELQDLLDPLSPEQMQLWPVSTRVNKPDVKDDASLIEPAND